MLRKILVVLLAATIFAPLIFPQGVPIPYSTGVPSLPAGKYVIPMGEWTEAVVSFDQLIKMSPLIVEGYVAAVLPPITEDPADPSSV